MVSYHIILFWIEWYDMIVKHVPQGVYSVVCRGVSENRLHGCGRFNLQTTSRRRGIRSRDLPEYLGRLEQEGWGNGHPEDLGRLQKIDPI
jgi:hypothetical protein